ncbi:hypothetical protein GCM10010472_52730 [Pseudonocardia halophobica]|uniref:Uncharacterized protein n=1 Tax=Pseudonocardia halophobica TaxID=29401 RepID=A0A9W6L5G6_9PSEU|nr:hypothetical protein [Pseudonocardia halophobica]GLL11409.1 hypothetical protein GCM10017577_25500 [Pseudonocardia halophobica]
MSEPQDARQQEERAVRRMPDPLALIVGLVSLGIAGSGFLGRAPDLSAFDARWLLAGGAVVLGLVLLVASVRKR